MLINSIQISPVRTVCFIAIPYLTSVYANILITRKLRSKEALYACTGITMILCIVPYSVQYTGLIDIVNPALLVTILIIILAVTMRQSVLYVKESENIAWNLC